MVLVKLHDALEVRLVPQQRTEHQNTAHHAQVLVLVLVITTNVSEKDQSEQSLTMAYGYGFGRNIALSPIPYLKADQPIN